ncbi:GAF and ANTAR domain-containing protein [Pseudonocardia kujensis]|uniref:GAF and ANTAR domain-containing protein n=1 Tax=Pseudonocardia kujensis TaxID=1128675 RepID=UPI001E59FECA|nr:GAF and ANTAR domain-containing protein [Pseudonocardia kujensis]MCE0763616.1 GAF and ANTAR domain-containing protein [Pseudonocardia kujensis]
MSEHDRYGDLGAPPPLVAEFVSLSEKLLDAPTVQDVLDRIAQATVRVVNGADIVSVSLRSRDGTIDTPATTDPVGVRLDELQNEFDEGPCLDASRVPGVGFAFSADVAAGEEFPKWGPAAAELGVGSAMAVGLFPAQDPPRIGSLDFYSRRPGGLDQADRDTALVLAAHASTAVAGSLASTRAELKVTQLTEAVRSRDVIGQAKGILMERRGVDAEEAFRILRSASQSLNVKLARIAETLTQRRDQL